MTSGGVRSRPSMHDEHVACRCPRTARRRCWRRSPRRRRARGRGRGRPRSRRRTSSSAPATALRSLRIHGTMTTVGRRPATRSRATRRRRPVGGAVAPARAERADAAGHRDAQRARRPVVGGRRPRRTPPRSSSSDRPIVEPEHRGRAAAAGARWRRSANGSPSTTCIVSNTPSPTVTPWSSARDAGARRRRRARRRPTPTVSVRPRRPPSAPLRHPAAAGGPSARSRPTRRRGRSPR